MFAHKKFNVAFYKEMAKLQHQLTGNYRRYTPTNRNTCELLNFPSVQQKMKDNPCQDVKINFPRNSLAAKETRRNKEWVTFETTF